MGEHEHVARFEVVADGGLVDDLLRLVGNDHHDDLRQSRGSVCSHDLEARGGRTVPSRSPRRFSHHDLDPAIPQILRVRVPLAAKADYSDSLPFKKTKIGVFVVQHLCHLPPDCIARYHGTALR